MKCIQCGWPLHAVHRRCTNLACSGGTVAKVAGFAIDMAQKPAPPAHRRIQQPQGLAPLVPARPQRLVPHPPARPKTPTPPAPTVEERRGDEFHRIRVAVHGVVAANRLKALGEEAGNRRKEAELLRQERERVAFLRRLDDLAKAITAVKPVWDVEAAALSDTDLERMAQTGRWLTLSKRVTLDWKATAKKEAAKKAKDAKDKLEDAANKIRGTSSAPASAPADASPVTGQETAGVIQRLLISAAPDISVPDLATLSGIAGDILGQQVVSAIASSVPFLSTIVGVSKAVWATKKAVQIQVAKKGAVEASVSYRPGTPELATNCVIGELEYMVNFHAGTAAINATAAVVSVFDLGSASGPAKSLAELAISVHALYRSYMERQDYRSLVAAKPYEALQRSPTVSAYVLMNYPAVGLMDPRRPHEELDDVVARRLGFLWEFKKDAKVISNYKILRAAAQFVVDGSRLQAAT